MLWAGRSSGGTSVGTVAARWLLAVAAVGGVLSAAIGALIEPDRLGGAGRLEALWMLSWLGLPIVGAGIVARRPTNRVGWLMLAVGCGVSAGLVSAVPIALGAGPDSTRAALVAMWLLKTVGFNVGFGSIPLLILHFPSGVPQRGLRRRLATVSAVLVALSTLAWLIRERDHFADGTPFPNPLVPSVVGDLPDGATMPLAVGLVVATLVAIGTIAYRYRRLAGIERLQLRWFAAATASLPVLLFAGNIAASHLDTFGTVLFYAGWALGVNGIAVAIGIAVTRYHLYEIDRIISRTVTYGMVTAVLFVVYIVTVTIPGAIFGLTSDLLVAAATLASAVVFVPVRRRIQDLVDVASTGRTTTRRECSMRSRLACVTVWTSVI